MPLIRFVDHLPEHIARYLWRTINTRLVGLNRLLVFYRLKHIAILECLFLFLYFLLELFCVLRL